MFSDSVGNSLSFAFRCFLLMCCFSISRVLGFSLPFLPMVCFAPVMLTIPFCRLMSVILSHVSSIGLEPRSLDIDRMSAIRGVACDMSIFTFSSVWVLLGVYRILRRMVFAILGFVSALVCRRFLSNIL
jgi:hypothetical protein